MATKKVAKPPAKKKAEYQLTPADLVQVLEDVLRRMHAAGMAPEAAPIPADGERPAGMVVFIPRVSWVEGRMVVGEVVSG